MIQVEDKQEKPTPKCRKIYKVGGAVITISDFEIFQRAGIEGTAGTWRCPVTQLTGESEGQGMIKVAHHGYER